jgi:hypothetical protein
MSLCVLGQKMLNEWFARSSILERKQNENDHWDNSVLLKDTGDCHVYALSDQDGDASLANSSMDVHPNNASQPLG